MNEYIKKIKLVKSERGNENVCCIYDYCLNS